MSTAVTGVESSSRERAKRPREIRAVLRRIAPSNRVATSARVVVVVPG